jgi:hypothetical protein
VVAVDFTGREPGSIPVYRPFSLPDEYRVRKFHDFRTGGIDEHLFVQSQKGIVNRHSNE